MSFIKKSIIKYKGFASDMMLNMIGFAIYIFSQQILLLPILAKSVEDTIYSKFVLYLAILNVVCNVAGGELGNVRLVRNSKYENSGSIGDFGRILLFVSIIISVIIFPLLVYLKYSVMGSVFLTLTLILANVRLYSTYYYRLEGKYYRVIAQNAIYLIGIVSGLVVYKMTKRIDLILFVAELLSSIYAFKNSDLLKMKLNKTAQMMKTIGKYIKFGFISFLTNMMTYFDKFLIYPMFGPGMVAVYYACNSMSKITGLITNPMASVILSWVSQTKDDKNKNKILKLTIITNIPIILIVSTVTIPCTYIALKILYSQYLEEAKTLIIPISLASGFGTSAALTKSVLLKYIDTNKLLGSYLVYFVAFVALAWYLSKTIGIIGFSYANLISKVLLCLMFIILLKNTLKTEREG